MDEAIKEDRPVFLNFCSLKLGSIGQSESPFAARKATLGQLFIALLYWRSVAMVSFHITGDELWKRMNRAVEKIQERLERTAKTLAAAKIPYAIIGGNAVRAWVAQADEAAVRTTRDVDILLQRSDLSAAIEAMEAAGFTFRIVRGLHMFLDGPNAKARDAVHVLFAGEKVRPSDILPAPEIIESEPMDSQNVLTLEALVRMKLNVFRDKDRMHLRDMLDVELIDQSWTARFQPELAARLQELIDNPEDSIEGAYEE